MRWQARAIALTASAMLVMSACQPFGLWRVSLPYRDISLSRTMYVAAQWNPRQPVIAAVVRVNNELVPWSWLLNSDELVLLDSEGSRLRTLFRPPATGIAEIAGLAWWPDGRHLLCQVRDVVLANNSVSTQLWAVDTATGSAWEVEAPQLPPSPSLSVSPDGQVVAGRGFLWNMASGVLQRYPDGRLTVFSPQGREAILAENVLYIRDTDGALRALYTGSQQPSIQLEDPTWSPNGALLAVSVRYTEEAFHNEVVILHPEGGMPVILSTGLPIASLSWSPDGAELLGLTAAFVPRRLLRLSLPAGLGLGPATQPETAPSGSPPRLILPRWLPEGLPAEPQVQRPSGPLWTGQVAPWTLVYSTAFTRSLEIDQYPAPPPWWQDAPGSYLGSPERPVAVAGTTAYVATLERGYPPRRLGGGEGTLLEGRARLRLTDLYVVIRWRGLGPGEVLQMLTSMVQ